jgi:hypothetical protein
VTAPTPAGSPGNDVAREGTATTETVVVKSEDVQLAQIETQVTNLATANERLATNVVSALERLTESSQAVGKIWMQVPGVIGVIVVAIGLVLLFYAFIGAGDARFTAAMWGGVVLVGLGALSATASAIASAKVMSGKPERSGTPTMPRTGR